MSVDELIAWLHSVLAQEASVAQAAARRTEAGWSAGRSSDRDVLYLAEGRAEGLRTPSEEVAAHVAGHDPRSVLDRVQAERSVLSAWAEAPEHPDRGGGAAAGLAEAVKWLAWGRRNDAPGYRAEWTPDRH